MKVSLFFIVLLNLAFGILQAQISYPTNREIYDFSVGDTFIYNYWHYSGSACDLNAPAYYCSHDYYVSITGKSFSLDSNSVYYTYAHGGYSPYLPFWLPTSYSNLDSPVIVNTNSFNSGYDTAYIDSSNYCLPRKVASESNFPGNLSDFFDSTFESGLGLVESYYHADQGSSEYGNYSFQLIYYHKSNIICGQYDASMLVSAIEQPESVFNLKIFPNPANDFLMFEGLSMNEFYYIYDTRGSICQTGLVQSKIDIHRLSPGVYFVKIAKGGGLYRKFTKG